MSFRTTNRPSHRKMSPADFVSRWQHGNTLVGVYRTLNAAEWKEYCNRWGIKLDDAANRIRLSKALNYDADRIWQIALLQLPYDVVLRACSDRYTNAQREQWFALYKPPRSNDDLPSQAEAYAAFMAIVSPPSLNGHGNGYIPELFEDVIDVTPSGIPVQTIELLMEKGGNLEFAVNGLLSIVAEFKQTLEELIAK